MTTPGYGLVPYLIAPRPGIAPPRVVDPPPLAGRVPPHDLDAEAAVLSALLLDRDALDRVLELLKPEHFYSEANARIYQAAQALAVAMTPIDMVSVATWLRDREWLGEMGGTAYLAQLADATPAVAHVETHAKIVHEKWRLRQLIATCQRVSAEGYGDVGEVQQFIDVAEGAIFALAHEGKTGEDTCASVAVCLKEHFAEITAAAENGQRITGISTGYDRLDAKTTGLHEGDLIIVAARPGMGKALTEDSKVLTPTGWRRMGSLRVGMRITRWNNEPARVIGVYPQGKKTVFRVNVEGGRSVRCCDEHLWHAQLENSDGLATKIHTTAGLRLGLRLGMTVRLPVKRQDGGEPTWSRVESIEPAGVEPCVCIAVDAPDHLYVTDDFIVTHNTSLVMNIAVNVASPRTIAIPAKGDEPARDQYQPGDGVCVFSLEMPRKQLVARMASSEGRVDLNIVRSNSMREEHWKRLTEASAYISTLPIWIDEKPAISVLEIRARVRRKQAEYNREATDTQPARRVGLVVIDYLQLMKGRDGVSSREQEISEISRGLKALAKELKVPVIALSQLNRAVETRSTKDKRPQLSDLRESGAIEQDADTIIFIYRDDYYNPETSDLKGIAELIIAKQRNGPTGKIKVKFTSSYTRFEDLDPGEYPAGGDE